MLDYLIIGSNKSSVHSILVYIRVTLNLIRTDSIVFDSFLKFVSPLSGTRHVRKLEFAFLIESIKLIKPLSKFRDLPQFVVVFIVEDEANLVVRLKKASNHAGVVEHLVCTFDRMGRGSKEVQW